jgi:hypothetical protein
VKKNVTKTKTRPRLQVISKDDHKLLDQLNDLVACLVNRVEALDKRIDGLRDENTQRETDIHVIARDLRTQIRSLIDGQIYLSDIIVKLNSARAAQ